jgi:hypothetical protein
MKPGSQIPQRRGQGMDVSAVNRARTSDVRPRPDKIGIMVAQKTLEAARQNQESSGTSRAEGAKKFAHPYLGHNVDIYV